MSYQTVIRNATDELVSNTTVGIQISVLQGSAVGPAVYLETHAPMTNANGLASLEIGGGTPVTGTMAAIDWGTGPYFVKSEVDPAGGVNYTLSVTSELLSVPYALYAESSGIDIDWDQTGNTLSSVNSQIGIGTASPESSAKVEINSMSQGFLPPRMTETQRNAISDPAAGLMIYCTDCGPIGEIQFYHGTSWANIDGGLAGNTFPDVQSGADIDGEFEDDESGYSVSMSADGSRVAIGARGNDGNGTSSGHVRVFDWNGSNWVQKGADIDGEAQGDLCGHSVCLSGDGTRLAIGAIGNGQNAGHVRIFDWNESNWVQVGADIDGEAVDDKSGWSVSLSADGMRLAIGAYLNGGNGAAAGQVRVFEWSGSNWIQLGADIDGEAAGDWSGYSVSLSADGSRLAIGAVTNNGSASLSGHVRVFDWNGANWSQMGSDIDGESELDLSGSSVSLSADGSILAIGARWNGGSGIEAGHVRVFGWNGSTWQQIGADIDGEDSFDESGSSVSLSGDASLLAVGAPLNDETFGNQGHVRLFKWDGGAWVQLGPDINGEAQSDLSGFSVSLSADGSRLAIGAFRNDGNGEFSGHVRVYE
jgi:hypothetical protein